MTPVARFLLCLAVVIGAAGLHAMFMDWDMPLATGVAFVVALWAGRAWQKIEDAEDSRKVAPDG